MYETIAEDSFTIYRFLVKNSDRNVNHVLSCNTTKECVIIDPLDKDVIEEIIKQYSLKPKYIFNTHAHPDHIKYNDFFISKYKCPLLAHIDCHELFEFEFENVFENDVIKVGNLNLKVLHTPGHCHEHISLILDRYFFCGDLIFNLGVGNVNFRGDVSMLFRTITHKIKNLPDELLLLPGHDYLKNNITFLQSLYKDSSEIGSELDGLLSSYDSNQLSPLFDIGFEKKNNPFLRIDEFSFLDFLEKKDLFKDEKMEFRFKLLRQLRDEH